MHILNTNTPGVDPHADTPVEILHTILLGFVKYFWRDVVHNQLGSNPPKKELLKTRLNSLDISGLQIGQQLSGRTLVQYAGSLTGRDFRIIAQIAPYVLYDLVPRVCFDAWVSLSNLVPLIWQPEIKDIDEYIVSMVDAWCPACPTDTDTDLRPVLRPRLLRSSIM